MENKGIQSVKINDNRTIQEKNCFIAIDNKLIYEYDSEILWIEGWGDNALRIRSSKRWEMPEENWALSIFQDTKAIAKAFDDGSAEISNGKITARCTSSGFISIYNQHNDLILCEYVKNCRDINSNSYSALKIDAREFKPIINGDYELTVRFKSLSDDEKLYGMGQYQQKNLDLKGCDLELAQRNSQASVPFVISSLGYGMLWNNPSIGRATFAKNMTTWQSLSSKAMDYWIVAGDSPSEIVEAYAKVTGTPPIMPEFGLGLWQSKLRYQTQEELLEVAREYKRKNIPLSVIVLDYFHWEYQGEWKFDKTYWPDPDAMIRELQEMNIELMISVWPTVDKNCENYEEMKQKGYLIRVERGVQTSMEFQGSTLHCDATNPKARQYLWNKAKANYYDKGVKSFWLDVAEPEYAIYNFDNYRYYKGSNLEIGNIFPLEYARTFYDGMAEEGQENIVNLVRCAWAGSQKYGALVWSGDIYSDFETLRNQYAAGLNIGIAGIPWWTTDIGGFHGGWVDDTKFHELFVRWFEYGTFCPVMRLHGDREPHKPQYGTTGGATCLSGADNEVWSYGEKIETICIKFIQIRELLKPYIRNLMREAHLKGSPIMRTLFYEFPEDENCWNEHEEYMFGADILVAPVMYSNVSNRTVYLPKGNRWIHIWSGDIFDGGQTINCKAPLGELPVFIKENSSNFNDLLEFAKQ